MATNKATVYGVIGGLVRLVAGPPIGRYVWQSYVRQSYLRQSYVRQSYVS